MNKLRVGVIGLGKMGLLHAGIFNQLETSTVTAAAEKDSLTRNLIKTYVPRVKIYSGYEDMLKRESLDIVAVTTPVFLHKPIIESALDHGCHIFVEKPVALNGAECRSLLHKLTDRKTLVGYNRRFLETFKLAKRIIDDAVLGPLNFLQSQMFVTQVLRREQGWRYDPALSGGGVIIDLGTHVIDMLHYLVGPIERVSSVGGAIYSDRVDDYVSTNVQFAGGLNGSLELSWSVRNYRLPEMKIVMQFDSGVLTVTEKYVEAYADADSGLLKQGWSTFYLQDLMTGVPVDLGGPEYTTQDAHLNECIHRDEETRCNLSEAAKTNFVVDAMYESLGSSAAQKVRYEV